MTTLRSFETSGTDYPFMGCAMGTIDSSTQYNSHDRLLIFINV